MARDRYVGSTQHNLFGEHVALRLEDPAIDDRRAAMDDVEGAAGVVEMQGSRKAAHPRAHAVAHAGVGIGIPALGEGRAFGAVLEIAGAVLGRDGKLLLAVPLNDVAAPIGHEARCFLGASAVCDDVTRADDIAGRNSEHVGPPAQGLGRLEVRVRPPEDEEGLCRVEGDRLALHWGLHGRRAGWRVPERASSVRRKT